ncbi:hypothetical protein QEN19_001437 [Hanseniaspora menglaensis]
MNKTNENKFNNRKINNIYKQTNIKGSNINNYWTFREDEILTKSIQKYGTTKWNKIATLLVKKSAIQCKLRWEEYLLPKLHGNEQTKFNSDDDKELIKLYSMYKDQWKTIADAIGKTAASCLKRYNELVSANRDKIDDIDNSDNEDEKIVNMTIAESLQPKEFPSAVGKLEGSTELISHDAQQRLVSNLDKKKIKKDKADREFNELINGNIQKRRDMLKIGMKNYQLRFPNQISKFKRLNQLLIDENLIEPPKGEFDTSEEVKANRALLQKFEGLVEKKNVYFANKELGFEYLYKRRELVKEANKEKPVVQIGKVRNFKQKKQTENSDLFSEVSFLKKINFVKPKLAGSILNEQGTNAKINKIFKCEDKVVIKNIKNILANLPEPLNDFEIGDSDNEKEDLEIESGREIVVKKELLEENV